MVVLKKINVCEAALACKGTVFGDEKVSFNAVCIDSRKITPGCLFIAVAGDRFDGHDFAAKALEQGAAAVMCHKEVDCGGTVIMVEDTRKALLNLAEYYRSLFRIPVAGLTGSVGKTTTKEMVWAVLSARYKTLKNTGNLNNEIGMPMTVFGLDETYEAAVLEMGMSGFGEISRLSRTARPTLGIISNIGVSHMEKLGSQENILKAKMEILDGLSDGAPLILNGDDKFLITAKAPGHPIYYYGINNENCRVRAVDIDQTQTETSFTVIFGKEKQRVVLPTVGIHNVYNALAAFTAGLVYGVAPKDAAEALNNYEPSGMRQRIQEKNGITVIEDCYNASPDSQRAALNTLSSLKANRRIAVIGDMLELGDISAQSHYDVGAYAAQKADILFTYGTESLQTARGAVESGIRDCRSFADKEELALALSKTLKSGDAVLFKASRGMKFEDVIFSLYEGWSK